MPLPRASLSDSLRIAAVVAAPTLAKGVIARRPRAVGLAQRLDADARAVRTMRRMRDTYGPGPLVLPVPGRPVALVLEPQHVHRVLNESPEPFRLDSVEKRGALEHFQPAGVLVSTPAARAARRPFNEAVLDTGSPLHRLAGPMAAVVQQEMGEVLAGARRTGELTWDGFARGWWRAVRRVVLGDAARDDETTTDLLLGLRRAANWAFLNPGHDRTRRRFLARLQDYAERGESGSLMELLSSTPAPPGTQKHEQVPQWMFAFDATTWATFRALALVHSRPGAAERVRAELDATPDLPYARACVLESLRLWPTTPLILRETADDVRWPAGTLRRGSSVVVFAPLFHRDDTRLPEAHAFHPELWLRDRTDADWPLVPFSGGPGMCPGRNVVLLTASVALAALTADRDLAVAGADLDPARPLPGTLSPFRLRFTPQA